MLTPVKASGWFNTNITPEERITLIQAGIAPISDVFYPTWATWWQNKIKLFYGSYGCFSGDTLIVTKTGLKKISQLTANDIVLSFNEQDCIDEFKKVVNVFNYKIYDSAIEVTLKNNQKITATKCHKFYVNGRWVSLKNVVSLFDEYNLEKNTRLQLIRGVKRRSNKNFQLEKSRQRGYNETSTGRQRIFKNDAKIGRRSNKNSKSSQDYLHYFSRSSRYSDDCITQKPYKNRQSTGKFRMDVSGRQFQGGFLFRNFLHAKRQASSYLHRYRRAGKRNKEKIQTSYLYTQNVSRRIWHERGRDKINLAKQELEVCDIKSWKCVNTIDEVYDISVCGNHNYYIYAGKPILVHNSGKSDYIATRMLDNCAANQYYKGFFGRKVQDKVRESCHSKLVSIIKRHKREHEFNFSEQPNGSMAITHRRTGNKLLPYGAQSPDDMKSVDDPTEIWMEEADQFDVEDMRILLSRLRTPKAAHSLVLSFNTAPVMPGHWILKYFFPDQLNIADKDVSQAIKDALSAITIVKVFCNFTDNFFQDKEEYLNTLRFTAGGDEAYLRAIAYGDWGVATEGLMFPLSKLNFIDFSDVDMSSPDFKYFAADPADLGGDSFAAGDSLLLGSKIYIDNIIYNELGASHNERECAKLISEKLPHAAAVEGVIGWKEVATRIRQSVQKNGYDNEFRITKPRTNKKVRIAARATFIKNNFVFRSDYNNFPEYAMFLRNLTSYMSDGSSKHDDAADLMEMHAAYYESNFNEVWVQ